MNFNEWIDKAVNDALNDILANKKEKTDKRFEKIKKKYPFPKKPDKELLLISKKFNKWEKNNDIREDTLKEFIRKNMRGKKVQLNGQRVNY